MDTEMTMLLKQLHSLLEDFSATIVRSADDSSKLVLCIDNGNHSQREEFEEEIGITSINHGWHKTI